MVIRKTSGLPIPMVPRLLQSNGYIKWKLRAWRVQKCNASDSGDTAFTSAGPQTTPFHGGQYRAQNGNTQNFGTTNPNRTTFPPKQWLYQKESTGMESSNMYCPSWCRYRTYQYGAANYPVSWGIVEGPELKNAKFRAYQSPWYCICTKALVISKGSYGHGEFKNVSPQSVQIQYLPQRGRKLPRFMGDCIEPRMEICGVSGLPIPMVPRLHQSNGYIKRKLRAWRVQKCTAVVGVDNVLTNVGLQTSPFHSGQYRAQKGKMRKFEHTNPHGSAFAPKQWLYQKEATGMYSSKMYCPTRCRYHTYQCGAANYPFSWGVVQGPEWKYAKLRANKSPWYRVCTKAIVVSKGSYGHGDFKNILPQSVQIPYLPVLGR